MEISPGVEIVWNLAGAETRAARMKEIDPDHFFCGLLKFSEMKVDEIQTDQVSQPVVAALKNEMERLRKMLSGKSIDTTFVRREIRMAKGQGTERHSEDDALHRSEAGRQLFDWAAKTAAQNKTVIDSPILLQTLFAHPTQTMIKILGVTAEAVDMPEDETSSPDIPQNQFIQEMPGLTDEQLGELPAANLPQMQVLSWALRRQNNEKSICLICDNRVDVLGLVQRAARKEQPQVQLIQMNTVDLLKSVKKTGAIMDCIGDVLTKANGSSNIFLLFDTTGMRVEKVTLLLKSLKPVLEASKTHLVLAIQVGLFNQVIDSLQMDGLFQEIWLHDLKEPRLPHQL